MSQHFGGTVPVQSVKACVAYDSHTGRVHHIHHSVTLEGGRECTEQEMESHAIAPVRRRGISTDKVYVLHVPDGAIRPGVRYAVDPKARKLVEKA